MAKKKRSSQLLIQMARYTLLICLAVLGTSCGKGVQLINTQSTKAMVGPDPLAVQAWHLSNNGQKAFSANSGDIGVDLNLQSLYHNGKMGSGVRVGIIDAGTEINHPDLSANIDATASFDFKNNRSDPTNLSEPHGTLVAGVIGAVENNGVGSRGIAPKCTLISYRTGDAGLSSTHVLAAYDKSTDIDVYNLSFGLSEANYQEMAGVVEEIALQKIKTEQNRNSMGAVLVKAAGNTMFYEQITNGASSGPAAEGEIRVQSAQHDLVQTYPYVMAVAAVNARGIKSEYSQIGANIWIGAPSGEYEALDSIVKEVAAEQQVILPEHFYLPSIITTDLSGCQYGEAKNNSKKVTLGGRTIQANGFLGGANVNNQLCNYSNYFTGTSAAAPMVSGVAALILEANPNLSWRDVKHVLAASARKVDENLDYLNGSYSTYSLLLPNMTVLEFVDYPWMTNAAGFNFHNAYGFGLVDTKAAADLAASFSGLPPFESSTVFTSSDPAVTIPNFGAGLELEHSSLVKVQKSMTIGTVGTAGDFIIESVRFNINVNHSRGGDIGIEVTSPSGSKSILQYVNNSIGDNIMPDFFYLSNAFYGETALGNWKLEVYDGNSTGGPGELAQWSIQFYGHRKN